MTRSNRTFDTTAEEGTDYTRLTAPTKMTTDHLNCCANPDAVGDADTQVFAVAFSRGMAYNATEETEYEAVAVLYMTADGERVTERWFRTTTDPVRACLVDGDRLDAAGPAARRFADALACHPEVDDAPCASDDGVDRGRGVATDGGVMLSGIQHAMEREGRLYDEPIGPEPARTTEDYLAHYEAADLSVGDTVHDRNLDVTDEVVAIFENRQPDDDMMTGDLVHLRKPEGGTYVDDAWGVGYNLAHGVSEVQPGGNEDCVIVTDGGVDHDDEFDGGASIIEVDGYESYVDPEHLDSCERAGAEVREE